MVSRSSLVEVFFLHQLRPTLSNACSRPMENPQHRPRQSVRCSKSMHNATEEGHSVEYILLEAYLLNAFRLLTHTTAKGASALSTDFPVTKYDQKHVLSDCKRRTIPEDCLIRANGNVLRFAIGFTRMDQN